jgi:hypothetical protein
MKQIIKQIDIIVGSKTFNRTVVLAFFTMSLIYNAQEKCSTAILFAIYAVLYYLISDKKKK